MQIPVVFFEKAFLIKLTENFVLEIGSNTNWELMDFYNFITRGIIEFNLVLDCEDDEEQAAFLQSNNFFNLITEKVRESHLIKDFKKVLNDESFETAERIKSVFSLFFVDWEDWECQKYECETGFLIFNFNRLKKRWASYSCYNFDREKYITGYKQKSSSDFTRWNEISFLKQPFNTILFQDPFLFEHATSIEYNFTPIIEAIFYSKEINKVKVQIVFKESLIENLEYLYGEVKRAFISALKNFGLVRKDASQLFATRIEASILKCYNGKIPNEPAFLLLHDRFFITNNLFVHSPGGFNIYGDDNKLKSTFIRADFIFYKDVFLRACTYVDNIKLYTSECLTDTMCYSPNKEKVSNKKKVLEHPFFK